MGADVLLLDLAGVTLIADYFVIASADSDRQLRAISQDILHDLKREHGVTPLSVEGTVSSGWILVDFGGIVIHLFSPGQREYYALEEFWSEARTVLRIA